MKKVAGILFFLMLTMSAPSLFAAEETTGDYMAEIGTKFGRGLENILTSPAEIPCVMSDEIRETGAAGSLTGLGKGILWMCRRILVGVTEVGTFMIPMERTLPPVCRSK